MGVHGVVRVPVIGLLAAVAVMVAMLAGAVVVPPVANAERVRNGLIAYTTGNGEEERYAIWTIKPDGTDNRRLLRADRHFEGGPSGPRWSRDGRKLLFARSTDMEEKSLWYLTVATTKTKRVPLPVGRGRLAGYDWAPNGRRVVISLMTDWYDTMLYTLRVDGSHVKRLRPGLYPSWSGDGRHIVFTLMKHRDLAPWASTVNVVRPSGAGFRRLSLASANDDWSPSFSPDGTKVLYSRSTLPYPEWRIADVMGGNDRLVWTYPTQSRFSYWCPPQWTPNGKRLATVRTEELSPAGADGPLATALVTFNLSGRDERKAFTFPSEAVGTYGGGGCPFSWQRAG